MDSRPRVAAGQQAAPIVVGVDGSDASTKALNWAANEALRRRSHLHVAHAAYFLYGDVLSPETAVTVDRELETHAADVLTSALRLTADRYPTVDVSIATFDGDPIEFLIDQSKHAALIVMGSPAGGRVAGAVLESVCQSVAAHAKCPVVIVRDHQPRNVVQTGAVVIGVSPTERGLRALWFAFEEANLRQVDLIAVRSWGDIEWNAASLAYDSTFVKDWEHVENRVLEDCLAPAISQFPGVKVQRRLVSVRARWALEQAAIGADLLVVGGHRPDDHWFSRLGPVASSLLHCSPCPLAIIGDERAGDARSGVDRTGAPISTGSTQPLATPRSTSASI